MSNQLVKHSSRSAFACALFAIFLGGTTLPAPASDDAFTWPVITSQTRPWAYWWWMGSAVDKTNITKELTRYHDAGLGGVHIIPIYGAKLFEIELHHLSFAGMDGDDGLVGRRGEPAWHGGGHDHGHRLVFRRAGGFRSDANASVVVKTYDLGVGEKLEEKFTRESIQALVAFGPEGKSIDLTGSISTNGVVSFSPSNGTWRVYAISQKPSGQKVKRAAPGGEGWMLNLFFPPAMGDYLCRFSAAFDRLRRPQAARPISRIPTNTNPTGRRIFLRSLKNGAATNCRPNCPRSSARTRRPRRAREIRLPRDRLRHHGGGNRYRLD